MRGLRSLLNSTLQGLLDMLIMFISGEVFKLRMVFLKPLCSNSGHVGYHIVILNCPSLSGSTMEMNGWRRSARTCTYESFVRILSRQIKDPISLQMHTSHTITEPPAWTFPCWHAGSMDSWGSLHTRTRPSAQYNWKRDSSEQTTYFQSSTVQWRHKALCRAVSKCTRVGLQLRNPISMMFCWMTYMLTLVDSPVLKSAAICWTVLFSHHWFRSCRIFFQLQRFDVLPDCRYSQWTHEMVVQ